MLQEGRGWERFLGGLRKFAAIAAQVAILWLFSWAGHELVLILHLPLPGNVAGLLLAFAALSSGVLPLRFVERGGAPDPQFAAVLRPACRGLCRAPPTAGRPRCRHRDNAGRQCRRRLCRDRSRGAVHLPFATFTHRSNAEPPCPSSSSSSLASR